jgi:uncharacterized protein with HEPN domain
VKVRYPDLPWREIAGTRDVLIHDYPDINFELVWETIGRDLPILNASMIKIREDLHPIGT